MSPCPPISPSPHLPISLSPYLPISPSLPPRVPASPPLSSIQIHPTMRHRGVVRPYSVRAVRRRLHGMADPAIANISRKILQAFDLHGVANLRTGQFAVGAVVARFAKQPAVARAILIEFAGVFRLGRVAGRAFRLVNPGTAPRHDRAGELRDPFRGSPGMSCRPGTSLRGRRARWARGGSCSNRRRCRHEIHGRLPRDSCGPPRPGLPSSAEAWQLAHRIGLVVWKLVPCD